MRPTLLADEDNLLGYKYVVLLILIGWASEANKSLDNWPGRKISEDFGNGLNLVNIFKMVDILNTHYVFDGLLFLKINHNEKRM